MIWPGFGVNYNPSNSSVWAADMAYFNEIGLKNIRPTMPGWTNQSAINTVEATAVAFNNAGFFVTWGISSALTPGTLTAANWPSYHNAVVAEATRLQANGYILGEFETGNELSNAIDNTTLTTTQLYANLQQLCLDVKAVYSGVVSYAIGGGEYASWQQNGLGYYDTMSFHPYGQINPDGSMNYTYHNEQQIIPTMAKFGNKATITEFGLDSNAADFAYATTAQQVAYMEEYFWNYIVPSGATKVYAFTYNGNSPLGNNFEIGRLSDGSMNPMWFTFFSSNPVPFYPRVSPVI